MKNNLKLIFIIFFCWGGNLLFLYSFEEEKLAFLKQLHLKDPSYYARIVYFYLLNQSYFSKNRIKGGNYQFPVFVTIMREKRNVGCAGKLFTNLPLKVLLKKAVKRAIYFDLRRRKEPLFLKKGDIIWVHFPYNYCWISNLSQYRPWKEGIKLGKQVVFPSEGKTLSYIKRTFLKKGLTPPFLVFKSLDFKYKVK